MKYSRKTRHQGGKCSILLCPGLLDAALRNWVPYVSRAVRGRFPLRLRFLPRFRRRQSIRIIIDAVSGVLHKFGTSYAASWKSSGPD